MSVLIVSVLIQTIEHFIESQDGNIMDDIQGIGLH